jgi:hypothetical protein
MLQGMKEARHIDPGQLYDAAIHDVAGAASKTCRCGWNDAGRGVSYKS